MKTWFYMSLKVAHQRGSGEFTGEFKVEHGGGDGSDDGGSSGASHSLDFNQVMQQGDVAMPRDRELDEMVSALAHVASSGCSQSGNEWIQRASSLSSYSSFGYGLQSGSWSGNKRGREDELISGSNQFLQQQQGVPRLFRNVGGFMLPSQSLGESSSSGATSLL